MNRNQQPKIKIPPMFRVELIIDGESKGYTYRKYPEIPEAFTEKGEQVHELPF